MSEPGKLLRIYIGEMQEWQDKPLYRAILELAQQHEMRGATVLRGIEGFGPQHHLSTERLPDISENLPILIEIVESEERVHSFLPLLDELVQQGTITLEPVEIVYNGSRA
ncbi:MAG TPA: DUF190 domain-containing protein [Ktedonobacteraceae bacterium]|jgi:PII-like signaling protein|nr:DUF190 domain-containing protein [Ktedonobacteraceae bacterium]